MYSKIHKEKYWQCDEEKYVLNGNLFVTVFYSNNTLTKISETMIKNKRYMKRNLLFYKDNLLLFYKI